MGPDVVTGHQNAVFSGCLIKRYSRRYSSTGVTKKRGERDNGVRYLGN